MFNTACHEPFIVLHTSGTTGFPKPVVIPQGAIALIHNFARLPANEQNSYLDRWRDLRAFISLPMFHSAGLMFLVCRLYYRYRVLFAPNLPLRADLAREVIEHGHVDAAFIPPSVLIEMSEDPKKLAALGHLKYGVTGGGPLTQRAGDLITSQTHVINGFGTTESCIWLNGLTDPENWAYLSISPYLGIEMRQHSDDLFESMMVRRPDFKDYQSVFYVFPQLREFSTKDLGSRHPTEAVWKHQGRVDDIIVYSTGEKFNPTTMESIIGSHPCVSSALVLGHGRFQSILLLEGVPTETTSNIIQDVMPLVEEANRGCPAYANIQKEFIIVTGAQKPLPRAAKGTVQRQLSEKLYQEEMDQLFLETRGNVESGRAGEIDYIVLEAVSDSSLKGGSYDIGTVLNFPAPKNFFRVSY